MSNLTVVFSTVAGEGSSGSLGQRFSQIEQARKQARLADQKGARDVLVNSRRPGLFTTTAPAHNAGDKTPTQRGRGRGRGRFNVAFPRVSRGAPRIPGRGGRGRGGGGRGGGRSKLSKEDLDKQLDSYLLKDEETAKAKLDDDLDAYMADQ